MTATFSIYAAVAEWGIGRETLKKKLAAKGSSPGPDGYTVQQINDAVFDEQWFESLRKITEKADSVALENADTRKAVVNVADFSQRFESLKPAQRKVVLDSGLTPEQTAGLLKVVEDSLTVTWPPVRQI